LARALSPVTLGRLTLRNRIVKTATYEGMTPHGAPSPALREHHVELARGGVYVEPTCAQAAAAFSRLIAQGRIAARESTVVVLTGTGLKATPRYAEMLGVVL